MAVGMAVGTHSGKSRQGYSYSVWHQQQQQASERSHERLSITPRCDSHSLPTSVSRCRCDSQSPMPCRGNPLHIFSRARDAVTCQNLLGNLLQHHKSRDDVQQFQSFPVGQGRPPPWLPTASTPPEQQANHDNMHMPCRASLNRLIMTTRTCRAVHLSGKIPCTGKSPCTGSTGSTAVPCTSPGSPCTGSSRPPALDPRNDATASQSHSTSLASSNRHHSACTTSPHKTHKPLYPQQST